MIGEMEGRKTRKFRSRRRSKFVAYVVVMPMGSAELPLDHKMEKELTWIISDWMFPAEEGVTCQQPLFISKASLADKADVPLFNRKAIASCTKFLTKICQIQQECFVSLKVVSTGDLLSFGLVVHLKISK